jgi:hypothetical protein
VQHETERKDTLTPNADHSLARVRAAQLRNSSVGSFAAAAVETIAAAATDATAAAVVVIVVVVIVVVIVASSAETSDGHTANGALESSESGAWLR